MKLEIKVVFGRDRICKKYEMGKDTFYELKKMGAPIKIVNNRYMIHTETFDSFLKTLSESTK